MPNTPDREVEDALLDECIRCPKCKRPRVYGEACPHCGDTFKAHPTVLEHLAMEKKNPGDR